MTCIADPDIFAWTLARDEQPLDTRHPHPAFGPDLPALLALAASPPATETVIDGGPGCWAGGLLAALLPGRAIRVRLDPVACPHAGYWLKDGWRPANLVDAAPTEAPAVLPDEPVALPSPAPHFRLLLNPLADIRPERGEAAMPEGTTVPLDPLDLAVLFHAPDGGDLTEIARRCFTTVGTVLERVRRLQDRDVVRVLPLARTFVRWHMHMAFGIFRFDPTELTLAALWRMGAANRAGHAAVIDTDGTALSFADAATRIAHAACGLLDLGLRPGDRISILAAQQSDLFVAGWAAWRAGLVLVTMGLDLPRATLPDVVDDLRVAAIIVDAEQATDLPDLPAHVRLIGIGAEPVPGATVALADLVRAPLRDLADGDPDAVALVLSTSGTTAASKKVAHGQSALVRLASTYNTMIRLGPGRRIMSPMAINDVSGARNFFLLSVPAGLTILCAPPPAPGHALRCIEIMRLWRPGYMFTYPVLLDQMIEAAARGDVPLPDSFDIIATGGMRITAASKQAYARAFGARLSMGLGMTECNLVLRDETGPDGSNATEATGRPNRAWIQLRDPDGQLDNDRTDGTLWFISERMTVGYLEGERLRPAGADTFGWFTTGDLVRRDANGLYTVIGRGDDIVKLPSGMKVHLATVEDCLLRHPQVKDAAVLPRTLPDGMETMVALVVVGRPVTQNQLRRHIRDRMGAQFIPERIEVLDAMPRNARGKIDRVALKARLEG